MTKKRKIQRNAIICLRGLNFIRPHKNTYNNSRQMEKKNTHSNCGSRFLNYSPIQQWLSHEQYVFKYNSSEGYY